MPSSIGVAAAPAMGWAIHSVFAVTVFRWIGFDRASVLSLLAMMTIFALWACFGSRPVRSFGHLPWRRLAAGALAIIAAIVVIPALLPHMRGDQIALAAPIFDHSKIAFVNAFARSGLPLSNPVFGGAGQSAPLPYYYLWHFSAAQIAVVMNATGWEADVALTWFTAFSSLSLMMGLAVHISSRSVAALWVLLLAMTASVRPFVTDALGYSVANGLTGWPSGFGGWLTQSTWAPQHVQSATCAIIAVMLLSDLERGSRATKIAAMAVAAAAALESSVWVGAFALPFAGTALFAWTWMASVPSVRRRLLASLLLVVVLASAIVLPFAMEQIASFGGRNAGFPVAISLAEVLDAEVVGPYARLLDFPAFFLTFLPVELCAVYVLGICSLWMAASGYFGAGLNRKIARAFVCIVATGLLLGSGLRSTVADNNDLGWRAVLPAIMVLIAAGAALLAARWKGWSPTLKVLLILLIVPGAYQGFLFVTMNATARDMPASSEFERSRQIWDAVRDHSGPTERVANNPEFLGQMTPWPVNISWALLSARPSCYAGSQFALPFIPLPRRSLDEIDELFRRVFAGSARPTDLTEMAERFDCRTVVLTPDDGAWKSDPFAVSPFYRLVDESPGRWRIYRIKSAEGAAR